MRLTLRTMLAYLDGILEPNDAQDLGKKVEESEFATGLVHRIRDVMRRLRLGAPGAMDRSAKSDPNVVAEYLDNTLGSEGVTDFEKVCLESDVHLAEVAACHQVLALVLGEPAEIDPTSRERMYGLKDSPTVANDAALASGAADVSTPLVSSVTTLDLSANERDAAARRIRHKPTVPEYLREPRKRRIWPAVVGVAALAVCIVVVLLIAFDQFQPGTQVGDFLARLGVLPRQQLPQRDEGRLARGPVPGAAAGRQAVGEAASKEPIVEPDKARDSPLAPESGSKLVEEATAPAPESVKTLPVEPGKAAAQGLVEPPTKEPSKEPPADIAVKPAQPPGPEAAPAPSSSKTETVTPPAKASEPKLAAEPVKKAEPAPAVTALPLPPEPVGRLTSTDQLLLRQDAEAGWVRVAANQVLQPERLLVLPTYRPKVTLTVGVTLEILGGTQIELLPSSPQELPGVRILYGRVVIKPLAKADSRLRVAFGSRSGVLAFADAESVAGMEVRRRYVPGSDPAGPSHTVANLYAGTGEVLWKEIGAGEDASTLRLTPQQWVTFSAALTSEPAVSKDLPPWIEGEKLGQLESRASASIAQAFQALPTDQVARVTLLELNDSRPQKEVRWLSLRCLGYVGHWRETVAALNDVARKLDWPEYVDELRAGVARDPQSAAAIRAELERQYPDQAADLYRMLWGYTNANLEAGEDEKLVSALGDDLLAVRVLSFWNLKNLTGLGLHYQPEQTAAKRQQPMREWRKRMTAGEIRIKTPAEKRETATEDAPPAAKPQ